VAQLTLADGDMPGGTNPHGAPEPGSGGVRSLVRRFSVERSSSILAGLGALGAVWLLVSVVLPLGQIVLRSVRDESGAAIGAANYLRYLTTPALASSFFNSLLIASVSTVLAVGLAFVFAFCLTRTRMPGRGVLGGLAMIPLYAPSLAYAVAFIYLFGNKGLITTGFFGAIERATGIDPAFDIGLYGRNGIILAETIFAFPHALMILVVALRLADGRLYEAATALRASRLRTFFTVTLPSARYALISAIFVCFTLVFTDFGIPKVLGGSYNVLATDIYKQVIGQQNFGMGATVSMLLLAPTVLAVLVYRFAERQQSSLVGASTVPLRPRRNPIADRLSLAFCGAVCFVIVGVLGAAMLASLVSVWPYDLSLSLRHYSFDTVGGGFDSYWVSVRMAVYSAVFGTLIVYLNAYFVEKAQGWRRLRRALHGLSLVPMALPGLVVGLMYVFFFNDPAWTIPGTGLEVPNPFSSIYGTMAILVLSNIVHFYTVSFLTASAALRQLDPELEMVSASLGAPFHTTLRRVTAPLTLPAILDIATYYFINAMATVSAVIFLYAPNLRPASVAVVNMDDAGDTAAAAAMSMLIVFTSLGARAAYGLATRSLANRTQAWRMDAGEGGA